MKVTQFEGTAEEFEAVAHLFMSNESETLDKKKPVPEHSDLVSAIREVLARRPVSKGQREVFIALADGELKYEEFLKMTDRTPSQMAGVFGALGRRISNTPAIKAASLPQNLNAMIKTRRDGESKCLSLTPYAEDALEKEGII